MVALYSYWRSTTSYRVRIGLNLKGVPYETVPVDLVKGEQRQSNYLALNPISGVPTLVLDDGTVLTQSMAILEWLDAEHHVPPLLPDDPVAAAKVRAAALVVACDIHPINNLKVGTKLKGMGHGQDEVVDWMNDWMSLGFSALQKLLPKKSTFCFGESPGLADVCLVPQLYNAHRWGCDLTPFGRLTEIELACLGLSAFRQARPENQPDAASIDGYS